MDETEMLATPIGFATLALGLPLYGWQDRALAPLELASGRAARRTKISVVTPNGAGKSERIVASAALWWAAAHARGKVVITSKDQKQLNNQVVPAIQKHLEKLGGWTYVRSPYFRVTTPTGGSIHAFVTDEAQRAEGWHKEDDVTGPLLMIVDEAKSIAEPIYQAIYRCGWNALMLVSSPGVRSGHFHDSHTKLREDFICIQAGLKDCPHIPAEKIADIIKTYGEEHPFTRSAVYGEFMDEDDATRFVVPLSSLLRCLENPPAHKRGVTAAFCDFAAGGDENVLATRDGNLVRLSACWREANKHAAVGRFIREFRAAGLRPEQIWCDASDKEMADLLAEAGWSINRKNFGAPAYNDEVYLSWGAEAWHETAHAIERCEVILPDDERLKAQLTTRMKSINARGKLCLEDKHAMRKRNLSSPDRADAVCGVLSVREMAAVRYLGGAAPGLGAQLDEAMNTGGVLAGAEAGW
jgi:hypothetical protein